MDIFMGVLFQVRYFPKLLPSKIAGSKHIPISGTFAVTDNIIVIY